MDRRYWDNLADDYESEIFSVLHQDRRGLVLERIERFASPTAVAADFGCGIGHFLPHLSGRFGRVIAVDHSPATIRRARARCARLDNVRFLTRDLAAPDPDLPRADFGLCVNALIMPSLTTRRRAMRAVTGGIGPGGHLVLVVPSLESALYVDERLIEWNLRRGLAPAAAVRSGFPAPVPGRAPRTRQGIVPLDGVPTKHYLREELVCQLEAHGMDALEVRKIEYPWSTEFPDPPAWMGAPHPWDWLAVARRRDQK